VITLTDDSEKYDWESQYAGLQGYVGDIRKPFEECPHCGEYKFTVVREPIHTNIKAGSSDLHWLQRLLAARKRVTVGYFKREICKNCGYKTEWDKEIFDEYSDLVEVTPHGNVLKEKTIYYQDLHKKTTEGDNSE